MKTLAQWIGVLVLLGLLVVFPLDSEATQFPCDWDGDRIFDFAFYRPTTGEWFILTSSSGFTQFTITQWGSEGDIPIPGDYDNDGRCDFAVYRPSTGVWHILFSALGYIPVQWGVPGIDVPVTTSVGLE